MPLFAQSSATLLWLAAGTLLTETFINGAAWANDKPYTPLRIDRHVDLQGTWSLRNLTPLERLPQFNSLIIPAAEAEKINKRRVGLVADLSVPRPDSQFFDVLMVEPIKGQFHSSVIVDPPDGLIPGNALFHRLRDESRAALLTAFDGPEVRPTSERCLQAFDSAAPILLSANQGMYQIIQTATSIVIAGESMHEARIVRMNATHNPAAVTSWQGDSIGRWEGDTLVVETKHFTAASQFRALGPNVLLISPETVVVERFTRIAHNQLHYAFTVTDPTFYTQPWSGENQFALTSEHIYEDACHEGNYALTNILQGTRVLEAQDGAERIPR